MSKPFNIEVGFISKLLETKDISGIKEHQIKASYFSGEHRKAFQFILDSIVKDGEVPTVRVFERKFPNYTLDTITVNGIEKVGTEESFKYWCSELRKKVKHNSLAEALEEAVKLAEDFDTEGAYARLKREIAYVEGEVEEQNNCDITQNTEDRKQAYLKKKETRGMQGLSYGIKYLDFLTKGLKKETLTTLIANTGVGKTWFEVYIGAYCQLQNCTVLQFVTEMSEDIMRDRYEAMLFSMMYGELSYNSFKSGTLSPEQEKLYFKFLDEDLPNCESLIISTAMGVMSIAADIDKYNPDIVLIDGVYLMEDDRGAKDDWLRVAHITRDLKKLAKRCKIPIFINTQADKNTSKKTGPDIGSIMYTQAIGQDSDDILALYRDEVMLNDREMCIKVLKQREGVTGKIMMNWNFDSMDFSEIYVETEGASFDEDGTPSKDTNTIDVSTIE